MHLIFILKIKLKGNVETKFHCILYASFMRTKVCKQGLEGWFDDDIMEKNYLNIKEFVFSIFPLGFFFFFLNDYQPL